MKPLRLAVFLALIVTPLSAHAAKRNPAIAPAEVLARVHAAHSIFVSNATIGSVEVNKATNIRDYYSYDPYKQMYYALAAWPGIKLVNTPAQADLIVQVIGSDPGPPALTVNIIDPKTQTLLWTTSIALGGTESALLQKHFAKGVAAILYSLEPQQPAPKPVKTVLPIPSQLGIMSKVFLQTSSTVPIPAGIDIVKDARAALINAKMYTLVDTPDQADLILQVDAYFDQSNPYAACFPTLLFTASDPKTKTILWTQVIAMIQAFHTTNEEVLTQSLPYALKYWKSLISKSHL